MPQRPERFYLPELDSLRFFAFLIVFILHVPKMMTDVIFWPPGIARSIMFMGAYGVDLFFALSAFLLTRLFLRERSATGTINVWSFYMRRILRIWPLYFFFIAFIAGLGHFSPLFAVQPAYVLMLAVFLGNFSHMAPLLFALPMLWSVSVEEQFYLLWPQVIQRTSLRGTRLAAIAMFTASTLALSVAPWTALSAFAIWENTFFRLHSFAVGILIGTIPHGSVASMRLTSRLLLIAGGLTLWFLAAHYSEIPWTLAVLKMTLGYPAIALGAGALVLAALGTGAAYPRLAANRGLVYLGKISYGLYVYHAFALVLAKLFMHFELRGLAMRWPGVIGPLGWPIYVVLSASLTLGMAMASYKWVESPFLRLKARFTLVPSRPV